MFRHAALVSLLLLVGLAAVASANQVSLLQGDLQLLVQSSVGVLPLDKTVGVCDLVKVKVDLPATETVPTTIFYLDGQPALFSNDPAPAFSVDTTALPDGAHEVRVEAGLAGARLASADLSLLIANAPSALNEQIRAAGAGTPVFMKFYRKFIPREVVWFDGREGDLEKHGFRSQGQVYITATDLFRHIGGTIIWGPTQEWIELHRGDIVVRIIPGSNKVEVNGQPQKMAAPSLRKADRTYVPVAEVCKLFGLLASWNAEEARLYVTY